MWSFCHMPLFVHLNFLLFYSPTPHPSIQHIDMHHPISHKKRITSKIPPMSSTSMVSIVISLSWKVGQDVGQSWVGNSATKSATHLRKLVKVYERWQIIWVMKVQTKLFLLTRERANNLCSLLFAITFRRHSNMCSSVCCFNRARKKESGQKRC